MLDRLLNNPLLFTVIMVAIVVVAVGLILYFLVFKDKIKQYIENKKIEKEQKLAKMEKDKALAGEVFAKKETDKNKPTSLTKQDQDKINKVISAVGAQSSTLATKAKKGQKKEVKELTSEEQAKIDEKISLVQGGISSGVNKTKPKSKKASKNDASNKDQTDKDDNDNNKSIDKFGFMDQFKNDKE